MRLDFNLLWVENQQHLVQSQKERLERAIRAEGFRLQVKFVESVDEAVACLETDVYSDHVDLILMDYDLGPGTKGDDGLVEVRGLIPFRDVVFYSSQANDLVEMVLKKGVQGVYCSTRQDLPDTSFGVFETLVKKVVDIDHSRGIVMGTTSDIDHFVMDALVSAFDKCTPEARAAALTQVQKDLKESKEKFEKTAGKAAGIQHPSELFENQYHSVYTSVDRLELLRKILKGWPEHHEKDPTLSGYIQNTLPKRNILAHVRVVTNGFSRKLVDRRGNEHTSANMKALRLELLQHHEEFEGLLQSLQMTK